MNESPQYIESSIYRGTCICDARAHACVLYCYGTIPVLQIFGGAIGHVLSSFPLSLGIVEEEDITLIYIHMYIHIYRYVHILTAICRYIHVCIHDWSHCSFVGGHCRGRGYHPDVYTYTSIRICIYTGIYIDMYIYM